MSDDKSVADLRVTVARGLSALNVMITDLRSRFDRGETRMDEQQEGLAELRTKVHVLEERLNNVKDGVKDVTGAHDLKAELSKHKGKEEAVKEIKEEIKEEKKVEVEVHKARIPLYIAIATGTLGIITTIINVIVHLLLGSSAGGGTPP